ncbi:MAG: hypothetical protein EZS28_012106 [Streblomastix strix]|uniref:NrS-1 polymerase-like helicase domain-containing protein n=1 Tax=Streblomastix strix TaxID=222440 RepID=A0A5J4WCS1_9EUKA|nr:MAG: hypothetical protein EZS28_012106 [Streblomastix strix]
MLPANLGLVKTAHGGLHAYCNRDRYTLPSILCVKCITLDNIEIDIFGQMFKYKEYNDESEQKELVQNRVIGPNSSFRETKNSKRKTLKHEAINDWANMTHLASLRKILDSWNVDIEIPYLEYLEKKQRREFGQQITEEGTINKMNDEIAQACIDGLKNLEIHDYPQQTNMEVSLLSIFSGLYGITNESIRAEGLRNIRQFNKLTANAERYYGQAASSGERYSSKNVTDIDYMVGKFNVVIENKILVIANEMKNCGDARMPNMDALKSIITESSFQMNEKYQKQKTMIDVMLDIESFNPRVTPMTEAKKDIINASRSPLEGISRRDDEVLICYHRIPVYHHFIVILSLTFHYLGIDYL